MMIFPAGWVKISRRDSYQAGLFQYARFARPFMTTYTVADVPVLHQLLQRFGGLWASAMWPLQHSYSNCSGMANVGC